MQRGTNPASDDTEPAPNDVAAAARLHARLPAEGRAALRTIEALGSDADVASTMRLVARALIGAAWDIASQRAAAQAKLDAPLDNEAAVDTRGRKAHPRGVAQGGAG